MRYRTMEKKMTKLDVINMMLNDKAVNSNEVYVAYLKHEVELLQNKKANKKPTKVQEENEKLKAVVLEILANGKKMTCSELIKADERVADLSTPKMSALVKQLVAEKKIHKGVDGKKSVFYI